MSLSIKMWVSQAAQWSRTHLPMNQQAQVPFLGREDALEKEMATQSSVLALEIPWTEKPGGLQSVWLQKSWICLSD